MTRETERAARERELLDSGVATARCDACGTLVARDFSWHLCISRAVRAQAEHASERRFEREFFCAPGSLPVPSRLPESIRYVPEWAEKL